MEGSKGKETANDPGKYDGHLKGFAEDITLNVTMGNKYKFVPKEGPPPGLYNPDLADRQTKSKVRDCVIDNKTSKLGDFMEGSKKLESANDPGKYDGHLKAFGEDITTKVTMGNKYKFEPKEGPPPGLYNPDAADRQTKSKIREVIIDNKTSKLGDFMEGSKGKEYANDPGKYDKHLTAFGEDITLNVSMGSKYKFVPKEGPPPGLYNPDNANRQTKPKVRDCVIDNKTSKLGDFMEGSKKMESANDPGKYDGHLKGFGEDVTLNITMGSKYKFVPKEGPPPGLYNPEEADSHTKPKIREVLIEPEQPRVFNLNDSFLPDRNNYSLNVSKYSSKGGSPIKALHNLTM